MWSKSGQSEAKLTHDEFLKHLRNALNHLYDPDYLRRSPLAKLFGVDRRFDAPSALQRILTEGIESLKPEASESSHAPAWRIYHLLFGCYVQQLNQRVVANQLGMSDRTLRREQQVALKVLAGQLWQQFDLEANLHEEPGIEVEPALVGADEVNVNDELAWLKNLPLEKPTNLAETFSTVLDLVRPLAAQHHVRLEIIPTNDTLPHLAVHPVALKQLLLNLLDVAIHQASAGQVTLSAKSLHRDIEIQVQGPPPPATPLPVSADDAASLDMARQLVNLCGGQLILASGTETFKATLTLPVVEQVLVLVIDDQADALQLLQRYISGTRYCLVSTQEPEQALSLAEKFSPQIIVLDVMMPEVDGWSVLAKLRQHPLTDHIPIIVYTILPQEELAYSLGANAFIRKPIGRQTFLDTLDRQIKPARQANASG